MKKLRKSLIILVVSLYLPAAIGDDCHDQCNKIISQADKIISDLHAEIDIYNTIQTKQEQRIAQLTVSDQEKTQELSSLWRNPWVLGGLGFIVGGVTVLYLKK